ESLTGHSFTMSHGPGNPWPLFRHHLRSILRAKKTIFLLLGLLMPFYIGLIINGAVGMNRYEANDLWGRPVAGTSGGLLWFQDGAYGILFPFLLPLVVAAFAAGAINEEVEGKTLPYLFTRPI